VYAAETYQPDVPRYSVLKQGTIFFATGALRPPPEALGAKLRDALSDSIGVRSSSLPLRPQRFVVSRDWQHRYRRPMGPTFRTPTKLVSLRQ
jgi:hypothetical protein